jgi:hypothetical protein
MRVLAALTLLATAAGCSATVVDEAAVDDDVADAAVHGAVVVERTVALPTAPPYARTEVYARFLQVSGEVDAATAASVVGAAAFDATSSLGCGARDASAQPPVDVGQGAIELLDVGDMVLHVVDDGSLSSLPLAARAFPDVGDLVSGVVYTSRDPGAHLPEGGSYLIETTGSALMDGFSIQVEAPTAPRGLRLAGVAADAAEGLLIAPSTPLSIGWEPGASGDRIVVEVLPVDEGGAAFRCVFEDRGSATVPASYLAYVGGSELDVIVHRLRETTVKLPGVDEAVVDFDYAVLARIAVSE